IYYRIYYRKLKKEGRKMKVIELLNIWVEDRNKLHKEIKVEEKIFEYQEAGNLYIKPNDNYFLNSGVLDCGEKIDRTVEIIEEKLVNIMIFRKRKKIRQRSRNNRRKRRNRRKNRLGRNNR